MSKNGLNSIQNRQTNEGIKREEQGLLKVKKVC